MALTLAPSLPLIILGLAIGAACGLICQAISTGYVTITAKVGRSSAVGLYVTSFYGGGSFGAALGGVAWTLGGWPACVALVAAMLAVIAAIVFFGWARARAAGADHAADRAGVITQRHRRAPRLVCAPPTAAHRAAGSNQNRRSRPYRPLQSERRSR